jgi:hypothetical protein
MVKWRHNAFLTSALDGVESQAPTPRTLRKATCIHWTVGWIGPEPVWSLWSWEKSLPLAGIDLQSLSRPVRSLYLREINTDQHCIGRKASRNQMLQTPSAGTEYQLNCIAGRSYRIWTHWGRDQYLRQHGIELCSFIQPSHFTWRILCFVSIVVIYL